MPIRASTPRMLHTLDLMQQQQKNHRVPDRMLSSLAHSLSPLYPTLLVLSRRTQRPLALLTLSR
eukprot:3462815-Prymnesium_polylepis.1